MAHIIVRVPSAVDWLAAAIYSTRLSNDDPLLPRFDELPDRLKEKFRQLSRDWLDAIIPILEVTNGEA